jgi:NitT/TauT family transport system substrate-binding protein
MFLGMMAEGKPIQLFASLLANEPINLVVRKDVAERRGFRPNSPLREKLLALAGLRAGLAPEVAPRLRALFTAAGLDATRELSFVTVPGTDQVQAFADGKLDLLFAHTPYLETALMRYGAILVVDASSGEIPGLADGQIHALAATREMIREKPELIGKVTAAIADAEYLIHSDARHTLEALMASGANRLSPELAAATIAVYAPAVPATPKISIAGIIRDRELYPAHPTAPDFSVVNVNDFVAPQFADFAAAKR